MNPEPSVFPFSVETSVSQKEYVQLMYGIVGRSRLSLILFFSIGLILSFLTSIYFTGIAEISLLQIVIASIGLILLSAWFWVRNRWAKTYLKSPQIQHPILYEFDEAGIATSGYHFTSKIDWELTRKIVIVKGFVLLYTSRRGSHLIRRSSISAAQLAAIEAKVKNKNTVKL